LITINRLIESIDQCRIAQELVAVTQEEKVAVAQAHLDRLTLLAKLVEEKRPKVRISIADLAEVRHCREIAELALVQTKIRGSALTDIVKHKMSEVVQELDRLKRHRKSFER